MTNILSEKLHRAELTKTQKLIADFFLHNQERIGNLSSLDVAGEIGVSDASIIRFCRAIGYEGYADLKAHIYDTLVQDSYSALSLADRMELSSLQYPKGSTIGQFLEMMQSNLLKTIQENDEKVFDAAADALIKARRKYIIGLRGCKGMAILFSRLLSFMLPDVIGICDNECTSFSSLLDAQPGDVAIIFLYKRYYISDITYARQLHSRGVKIILVTDDPLNCPVSEYAESKIGVKTDHMSFFNSTLGTDLVVEYLTTLVGRKIDCRERLEARDSFTEPQRLKTNA